MKIWKKILAAAMVMAVHSGCDEDKDLIVEMSVEAIYDACDAYYDDYGWYPVDNRIPNITAVDYGGDTNDSAQVVAALTGVDTNVNIKGKAYIDPAIVSADPWGQPYLFKFDMDFNGYIAVRGDKRTPGKFAVWSIGPNGTNEFGLGDDIMKLRF